MPSKTPEEDFKRFENFIDSMSDMEFEEKLEIKQSEGGFSDAQIRLIQEMRETIDEDKAEILIEHGYDIALEDQKIEEHRDALREFYSKW